MPRAENIADAFGSTPHPTAGRPTLDARNANDPALDAIENRLLRMKEKQMMIKAMTSALSGDTPVAPQEPPIKMALNIGDLVKSQSGELSSTYRALMESTNTHWNQMSQAQQEMARMQISSLEKRLDDIKANGAPKNDIIAEMERWKAFRAILKEEMGDPSKHISDPQVAVQLKQLEIQHQLTIEKLAAEREAARQQHEFEMEKWRQEREEGRARWEREMELQRRKEDYERHKGDQQQSLFSDIASALAKAVEERKGASPIADSLIEDIDPRVAEAVGAIKTQSTSETPFTCDVCKTKSTIQAETKQFTCKGCGTHYSEDSNGSGNSRDSGDSGTPLAIGAIRATGAAEVANAKEVKAASNPLAMRDANGRSLPQPRAMSK